MTQGIAKEFSVIQRHHSNARMSQMITYPLGGTAVVLSGLVADDPTGDVGSQTSQILAKIDRLLAEAGAERLASPISMSGFATSPTSMR